MTILVYQLKGGDKMLERKCIVSIETVEETLKSIVLENLDKRKGACQVVIDGETIHAFSCKLFRFDKYGVYI